MKYCRNTRLSCIISTYADVETVHSVSVFQSGISLSLQQLSLDIMLIPNCTSGKDVYILQHIPVTEGVGRLGP